MEDAFFKNLSIIESDFQIMILDNKDPAIIRQNKNFNINFTAFKNIR